MGSLGDYNLGIPARVELALVCAAASRGLMAWSPRGSTTVGRMPPRRRSLLRVLCHEYRRSKRRFATVREMKVGPSGSAIRSLILSHRKLLWAKAMVVSVAEKSGR